MRLRWTAVAIASTLGALWGCAQVEPRLSHRNDEGRAREAFPVKMSTAPAAVRGQAELSSDASYLLGKAAHGSGQLAQALAHYSETLARDPRHVGALNAAAVVHAQEGQLEDALKLFAEAMIVAPGAAHLHNNAGYAMLRAGRLHEAESALLRARDLDPANQQVIQNLTLLRAAQARAGKAVSGVTAQQPKVEPPEEAADGPRLVAVAPHVYALQPVVTSGSAAPAALDQSMAVALPAVKPLRGARVEVSNGAGTSRLARRTASRLETLGLVAARLTNAKPYRQAITEIQFGAGQEQLAHALRSLLPVAAKVVAMNRPQPGIQMRLVLGRDLTGREIAAWLEGIEQQQVAWEKNEGWLWG